MEFYLWEKPMTDRLEPQDPRNQYPRPPFSTPTQEMPGLVTNMMPFPDHGEKTYRGSGKLACRAQGAHNRR